MGIDLPELRTVRGNRILGEMDAKTVQRPEYPSELGQDDYVRRYQHGRHHRLDRPADPVFGDLSHDRRREELQKILQQQSLSQNPLG